MSSFAYTVRCDLPTPEIATAFEQWLIGEHLGDVLVAGPTEVRVVRPDSAGPSLEVRYRFLSRAAYLAYEQDHAPRLRAATARRFPPDLGIRFERWTGEIVHEQAPEDSAPAG